MALLINLNTYSDERGDLTVIEKVLPFPIKRIYYIYNVDDSIRGGHRHLKTIQAAVCVSGSCEIFVNDKGNTNIYILDNPNKCLILNPADWHTMSKFTNNAVLLVIASEEFSQQDYIYDKY
jgi:hypothetical protein